MRSFWQHLADFGEDLLGTPGSVLPCEAQDPPTPDLKAPVPCPVVLKRLSGAVGGQAVELQTEAVLREGVVEPSPCLTVPHPELADATRQVGSLKQRVEHRLHFALRGGVTGTALRQQTAKHGRAPMVRPPERCQCPAELGEADDPATECLVKGSLDLGGRDLGAKVDEGDPRWGHRDAGNGPGAGHRCGNAVDVGPVGQPPGALCGNCVELSNVESRLRDRGLNDH